ncbi:cytidylyltransferase domain-containing protein [Chitinophaga niabensis]|uniref:Spore coat polysaccharide biosynthesis protein SpsF n=1 Tax=Chitinophaga niabensis TaxID=536979 RepID=A0A1N6JYL0_9BACT|nr:glycosyltransferase family protein [Chitinophaga niabensis]SIO49136.1 spore coat polysaccharide biosynthesis protein SpsF [Chitinophaga niabensis]
MQVVAVTQARIGSTRFPGKILQETKGVSLLEMHLRRILQAKKIDKLIVATTFEDDIHKVKNIAEALGVKVFQGSMDDVLDRFYQATRQDQPEYVVRLTSDCPLIDPALIDKVIQFTIDNKLDYASNTLEEKYPDGQDVEVFTFKALQEAWQSATIPSDREHVTPYIRKNSSFFGKAPFRSANFNEGADLGRIRMTVDEPADFEMIKILVKELGMNATMEEYVEYLLTHPAVMEKNNNISRNEGYFKSLRNDN